MSTEPEPVSTAEAELIERIVAGRAEEFSVLVERYQSMVFGMIMRQVGSRDVADELAQETFLRAFRSLDSFRNRSKFSTWLIRIALNQTSTWFASKRFREAQRTVPLDLLTHDRPTDGERDTRNREALLLAALGALAPKFRDVITLCGYEGRSYEEAAVILETPVGTIRSRLNRARLMLKAEVERLEGGES